MTATTAAAPAAVGTDRRGILRGAARSAGVRLIVLPVSALLGMVVTRLVIDGYGPAAYAQYGLLVGIGALLPFSDLGMSAVVMNTIASSDSPGSDERVRRVLVTAVRMLLCSAGVLTAVGVVLTAAGLWPALLGSGLLSGPGPAAAMACVALIAFSMPVGVGQRVLAGLGRNHISIAVLGLQTPLVLAALLLLLWWHVPAGPSVAVLAYGATFVLSVACCVIAARLIRPAGVEAVRLLPRLRGFRGVRVADTAWPMLVQSIALPIAMQTDRLVLSHRTGAAVLAQYNLASQMFTPIWAVVSSAGVTLWPVFARARARGLPASPLPMSGIFGGSAAVMAGAIALASPWLAELASGGRIRLPGALIAAFVVLMILQAVKYPLGTFLTDVAGLRFQALMIVLTLPLNLGLSWYLAGPLGAAGPVIGSIVGVAGAQVLANLLYVRRRLRSSGGAAA